MGYKPRKSLDGAPLLSFIKISAMEPSDAIMERLDDNRARLNRKGQRLEASKPCSQFRSSRFENILPRSSSRVIYQVKMAHYSSAQYMPIRNSRQEHQVLPLLTLNQNQGHGHDTFVQYHEENDAHYHPTSRGDGDTHIPHPFEHRPPEHTNWHPPHYRTKTWYSQNNCYWGQYWQARDNYCSPPPPTFDPPCYPSENAHRPPEPMRENQQPPSPPVKKQTPSIIRKQGVSSYHSEEPIGGLQSLDIVCGRGAPKNFHYGNQAFRELAEDHQTSYLCAKRSDKPQIAMKLLDTVKARGARFVRRQKTSGRFTWVEIDDRGAYEKVCQALRDGAPDLRRQMLASSSRQKVKNEKENEQSF